MLVGILDFQADPHDFPHPIQTLCWVLGLSSLPPPSLVPIHCSVPPSLGPAR